MTEKTPGKQLSVEELLKPRYKVIADYPNSRLRNGQILNIEGDENDIDGFAKYPHLFQKLEWWEERSFDLAGMYIRAGELAKRHIYYKLKRSDRYGFWEMTSRGYDYYYPINGCYPATKEEYDQFINTQNPQT